MFLDTWGVAQRTFGRLGQVTCPVVVAAGTETMPGVIMAPELEAPRIAAQIPSGRFEQCVLDTFFFLPTITRWRHNHSMLTFFASMACMAGCQWPQCVRIED